ncbi:hypothetical protein D5I55_06165 [Chakrabartia godavariana]|nr:hypothetical protein D5I55_06165 [Chakrabartia godavariana]
MRVTIFKGAVEDRIVIRRADGSVAETRFPKKGPVPHDAVHWIVEETLGLRDGFWGMIAGGRHPEEVQDLAKAAGHASAGRAGVPDASIVQLLQAERLVECFEAALWSGGSDAAAIRHMGEAGCATSHVAFPDVTDAQLEDAMLQVLALHEDWAPAPVGHAISFGAGPA